MGNSNARNASDESHDEPSATHIHCTSQLKQKFRDLLGFPCPEAVLLDDPSGAFGKGDVDVVFWAKPGREVFFETHAAMPCFYLLRGDIIDVRYQKYLAEAHEMSPSFGHKYLLISRIRGKYNEM